MLLHKIFRNEWDREMKKMTRGVFYRKPYIFILLIVFIVECSSDPDIKAEPWFDQPVSEWPNFAMTNEISFRDTTFKDVINSFIVDTGKDTIGVSSKHLFMVFDGRFGINSIDLGDRFLYWNMYPKNHPEKNVKTVRMINRNPHEPIGQFNTLKSRDWIIFELSDLPEDLYPLKIRYEPVRKGEVVYDIGWSVESGNDEPAKVELQCFQQMGSYFYTQTLTPNVPPHGRSGSAVIDKNGYLVGIVSGAEGNLGVIGSVDYLRDMFDQYGVEYQLSYLNQ